ncbi:cytochrome c oxidase cbb3-type subunit IV [Azospirillaceae bacterium]
MDPTQLGALLHTWWTVWLFLLFIGIISYAVWPANREKFKNAGQIPFKDEGQEF